MSAKTVRVNAPNTAAQQQQQQQPVFVDSDDESLYVAQQQQAFPVAGDAQQQQKVEQDAGDDLNEHLSREMFKNVQKKIIDIEVVASPSELAQTKQVYKWRLPPALLKHMKYNTAIKNRDTADGEQLAGNLNRCIALGLKIIQQQNTFPYAMGIRAPGIMLDETLHAGGSCLWRVPGQTQTMMVGAEAFSPVNIVNKYAYSNYRMCTVEDLMHDVSFPEGRSAKGRAAISVNSLAYQTLVQSLGDRAWEDQLGELNLDQILEPGRNLTVEVTEKIGKDIVAFLKPQVEAAAGSFVNLSDLVFEIVRADAHPAYDSPKAMIGEVVSSGILDSKKIKADQLQTRSVFHVKAEFSFVLF
jgi:hypothetical protein